MKKKIFTYLLLLITITNYAQIENGILLEKEYISKVGSICEETSEPNPCAGQEIYLTLKFKKEKVLITQKSISSCGEESNEYEFNYNWKLLLNNKIKIYSNSQDIKYTYLENLNFELKKNKLYAVKEDWNKDLIEYLFSTQDIQKHKSEFTIKNIDCANLKYGYSDKMIKSYEEALQAGIIDTVNSNKIEIEKFYFENIEYIFEIGGGCFMPLLTELYTKTDNDTVKIYWERKGVEPCPEVGEAVPFCGKIVINKKEHPNYKELKFKKIDNN